MRINPHIGQHIESNGDLANVILPKIVETFSLTSVHLGGFYCGAAGTVLTHMQKGKVRPIVTRECQKQANSVRWI